MDLTSLIGPAVIAAVVSGLVAIVNLMMNRSTTVKLHREKLEADQKLAERKFKFDMDLAERKALFDRELHDHKRQAELAEEVITAFYQIRDIFSAARFPISFNTEGEDRLIVANETERETQIKNSYYVPIARINKESEIFARLLKNRHKFEAYFGQDSGKYFREIIRIRSEITTAAESLIESVGENKLDRDVDFERAQKTIIWARSNTEDDIDKRTMKAVEGIERICRPILKRHFH